MKRMLRALGVHGGVGSARGWVLVAVGCLAISPWIVVEPTEAGRRRADNPCAAFSGFVLSHDVPGSVGMSDAFLGDFDADGDPDLVEAYGAPTEIRTFVNDGAANFSLVHAFFPPDEPSTTALGDVTGDGIPDLAWAETAGSGSFRIRIYHGAADGSFALGQELERINDVGVLAFGHVNADPNLDLVVGRRGGPISIYAGDGSGQLERIDRPRPNGLETRAIAIADFDDDGDADIMAATRLDSLYFYRQLASGSFADGVRIDTPARYIRKLFAADLDQDGHVDLVVATGESAECPDYVYHGAGDGTSFALVQTLCNEPMDLDGSADMALADLDSDGRLDLVVLRGGDFVQLGLGDGAFGPRMPAFLPGVIAAARVRLGLLDGDAVPDALVRDGRCCDTATHVYLGQPSPAP